MDWFCGEDKAGGTRGADRCDFYARMLSRSRFVHREQHWLLCGVILNKEVIE